jgi:hypothetical protein
VGGWSLGAGWELQPRELGVSFTLGSWVLASPSGAGMINRKGWGHSYFIVRGEIRGFMRDELLRQHLLRIFEFINNESGGLEDDQIHS